MMKVERHPQAVCLIVRRKVLKIFYFIIVLILIVLGILVWINFTERKAETVFSSDGIEIRVLEAEVQGVLLRIVEPKGELSIFN